MIGRKRMTREELNAHRRELYANPFHRALTRKVANIWRNAHKDELNARRRAKYAERAEHERARARAWREANKDRLKEYWKKWADNNREKIRERDRKRYSDPAQVARKKELRKIRESTPEGVARKRELRRLSYERNKTKASGLRWIMKFDWIPRWKRLETEGPGAEEKYLRKCCERTRMYYRLWKSGSPIIDRITKGGKA